MRFRNRLLSLVVVGLLMLSGAPLAVEAAPAARATLNGSAPKWANAANFTGAADPTGSVGFRVYLGWTSPAAAEALARSVSDPRSPSYGQYQSPVQFRQQFAPSQAQVGAVQSWLRS